MWVSLVRGKGWEGVFVLCVYIGKKNVHLGICALLSVFVNISK